MTQPTIETYIQSLSLAQPLTPSAEIQHLQLFVGKWNTEGETHASADAPAPKCICRQMADRRTGLCRRNTV
jgi:hypothetical protein